MNIVIEMGRLTKDPDIRNTGSTTIARFSLAVDRRFKREGQPDADFFNFVSFGRQAEFAEKYLKKGMKVVVQGRLQNNNYQKDGKMVYSNEIVVDAVEFCEKKEQTVKDEPQFMVPNDLEELPF